MPFVEKVITAGNVVEVRRYFSARIGKNLPRSPNMNKSPEQVEKVNARMARDRLEQWIHTNFIGGVDYFVTLTYGDLEKNRDWSKKPATESEIKWIKSECAKFMRKLRTAYKKMGIDPKYIKNTEIRDGDGVGIRPHHHLIINQSSMDMITKLWPHGRVTISSLDMDYQRIRELAGYFTKQKLQPEERAILTKRYDLSKNLKKPDVDVKEISSISVTRPPKEVVGVEKGRKKYEGYKIIEWRNGYNDINGPWQYVKMIKLPTSSAPPRSKAKTNKKRRC